MKKVKKTKQEKQNGSVQSYFKLYTVSIVELYTWGWVPNAVDMFHANFTNYLKNIVTSKLSEDKVSQALMSLSTSPEKSIVQQEHGSFLNLVRLKQKGLRNDPCRSEEHTSELQSQFHLVC